MFYVSDHGESLGENGLYLHGLPYFMAPDTQKHVPLIVWASDNDDDFYYQKMKEGKDKKYSHDNVFHTILGFMEVQTQTYNPDMDIMLHAETYK